MIWYERNYSYNLFCFYCAFVSSPQTPNEFRLPQLVMTILASGKLAAGKQNCIKEYMVIPRPDMPLKEVGLLCKNTLIVESHIYKL